MAVRTVRKQARLVRGRLDCDQIVTAALAEADDFGDFSMRALGKRLQVDPMAIYRHFRDKDELLDAMADRALAGMRVPSADAGTPVSRLREMSLDFRAALKAHPVIALRAITARPSLGPHSLELTEATLVLLIDMGLAPNVAPHAYLALVRFIGGFVAAEQRVHAEGFSETDWTKEVRSAYASVSPERLPNVARMASEFTNLGLDEQYEFGLDLLLEAIASRSRPK